MVPWEITQAELQMRVVMCEKTGVGFVEKKKQKQNISHSRFTAQFSS